jgi:hypothetical protein
MAKHDDLLNQGPRDAPEPETVEQQSRKRGLKAAGGGAAAGGLALAKVGILGKLFFWFFAYRGAVDAWHLAGWIGVAIVVAAVALYLVWRARRTQAGA